MTLGIDATVGYIDPDPGDGLTTPDFEVEQSVYNTPPQPGAAADADRGAPGLESLQAALDLGNVGYLYYVACGDDGGHAFSVDYETFLTNVDAASEGPASRTIGGDSRTLGVIGWPVEHSISPVIHNVAFDALGLDSVYVPLPVPPGRVHAAMAGSRGARVRRRERHDAAQDRGARSWRTS